MSRRVFASVLLTSLLLSRPARPATTESGISRGVLRPDDVCVHYTSPPALTPAGARRDSVQAGLLDQAAPTEFLLKRNHPFSSAETHGRLALNAEPSVASLGNSIFFTGNYFAAVSSDEGTSFQFVDPLSLFNASVGITFDQVVVRTRAPETIAWYVQYNTTFQDCNRIRLSRAASEADLATGTWKSWEITAAGLGLGDKMCLDGPAIETGSTFLYLSTNLQTLSPPTFAGSVVWRVPLAELAAGGTLHPESFFSPDRGAMKFASGSSTTMYWASQNSGSSLRLYHWSDSLPAPSFDDVFVHPWNRLFAGGFCPSPDRHNACGIIYDGVAGGWLSKGELGFLWMADAGGGYPYPHVEVALFRENDRAFLHQYEIGDSSSAWIYPSVRVNQRGDLGGTIVRAGPEVYPETRVWIVDDVSAGFSPLASWPTSPGEAGPDFDLWGDFFTTAPHAPLPETWVAGGYHLEGGASVSKVVPQFLWFGRAGSFGGNCTPSAETLCLDGGRFKVEVSWNAERLPASGRATVIPLTEDTGGFWFFTPNNVEIVVKVVDGRGVNGKFWVFYGALSNIAYTVTITDLQSGAVRTYENPQDRLASVADTGAF
jgi:hypothetical protein